MKITVYTDGASIGNPGPGGYGVVLMSEKGHYKELSAGYKKTTNNRMELLAVIVALESLKSNAGVVEIYSDSRYVVDAVQKGWLQNWAKKGFAKKKNPDLWQRYLKVAKDHIVKLHWLKGHAGHEHNERCDELAGKAALQKELPPDIGYENSLKRTFF